MGRSRFPGRPTKYTNRIRINVLPESSTTFGVSSVSMTVGSDDISKKGNAITLNAENSTVSADNLKVERVNRRRCKTLTKRRSCVKRNVLLSSARKAPLTPKIAVVNHVPRRTKAKVKSRRSVRNFSTLQKVGGGRYLGSMCDSNNLVGKFVLPSRSVHSSRVIKPNKRFISIDSADSRTFRKSKILPKKSNLKCSDGKIKLKPCKLKLEIGSAEPTEATACDTQSALPSRPLLREARLQIGTKNTLSSDGPFSLTSNVGSSSGYVTCGVCGARRFNRLLKQVKKFNIYSCESCRQFISKMIKRQKCKSINVNLTCRNGQGMCVVSTIRTQSPNRASKGRCSACWLQLCLKSFQLPLSLHNSLVQLLPTFMNDRNPLFGGSSFPLKPWPANVDSKISVENYSETIVKHNTADLAGRQRPVRLKTVKKEEKQVEAANSKNAAKRQKIDLKGPRVKHVCRSASIVLGQPLATFPSSQSPKAENITEGKKEEAPAAPEPEKVIPLEECVPEPKFIEKEEKPVPVLKQKSEAFNATRLKKEKPKAPTLVNSEILKAIPSQKKVPTKAAGICIDFWESYDPDEICKNGFCIIGSEPLPMLPICFLCGSGGREPLLHCSLCCEPYHSFCLEQAPPQVTNNNQRLNWLCPRCTKCTACGQVERQKISCQKCHKDYHPECFNDKWRTNDRPLVCSSCLRCKSCGSSNCTKFVGNIPLCITCFKLRKKGNFCSVCQKCYEENDYESKMMECNKCKKWIHARCENLSDEQYQILSILPESLEYQCQSCSKDSTGTWRQAIQAELRSSFNTVLRLLSKNKVARDIIKWSPLKPSISVRTLSSAKRLQFHEDDNEDDSDLEFPSDRRSVVKCKEGELQQIDHCNRTPMSPNMVEMKNKLNSAEYMTLREFHVGMKQALLNSKNDELHEIYCSIMKKVFPWFDPDGIEECRPPMAVPDSKTESEKKDTLLVLDNPDKCITTSIKSNDARICILCKGMGDGLAHQEARLLYCGHNEWIHANCALWSSEVYEEIDGSLQNVPGAISRSRSMRCAKCKHKGASVGCCQKGCYETYHFRCAQLIRCYFLHDKTVYCNSHDLENKSVITTPSEFCINRSVYIELDKKKKKYLEPEKVHFMVGSLAVSNLGKIIPVLSDTSESLLPAGFICTRLFWSTVEPWKLVPYLITTSVLNTSSVGTTVERNFTIDHSLPKMAIEKKLRELNVWLKDIEKNDMEDDIEEEQQNVDILPAELINDDIFEVLQHDLLDEISVQDMLMSYEELLNMDFKNSEINYNDNIISNENFKKSEDDDCELEQNKSGKELKRCKSEVFTQISELSKARSQQRSCSLTFSCKMDNTINPVIKKRKITQINLQLLQVDGAADSSESECGSPTHEMEDNWSMVPSEEPVTCEKCQCTYRTAASYKRHLESCDALFTSESDSEEHSSLNTLTRTTEQNSMESNSIIVKINEEEPRMIASYESYSTYHTTQSQVHSTILNTHSTFVSSEATNEVVTIPDNQAIFYPYQQQIVQQKPISNIMPSQENITMNPINQVPMNQTATITIGQSTSTIEDRTISAAATTTLPVTQSTAQSYCVNQAPLCVESMSNIISVDNNQSITINPTQLNQHLAINPQGSITINQPVELQSQQMTIQQVPFQPVLNIAQQNPITIDAKVLSNSNICNPLVTQAVVPQNQWVKSIVKPTIVAQKTIKPRVRPTRNLAAKQAPISARLPNGSTVVFPQNANANASVIFQHMPSTNMVPTFVDQFQQQSSQNLQYVATIAPQINQPQLVQLQPENNFLSIVPGVQPTMIIQQPRVVQDQLIVDSSGSMIWATQPVQPLYYGYDTIVQNTVAVQSQQFLPTTVPGVLTTNSSYSATTQVFQTSKLETVLDVSSGSFVLVNNCPGQILNSQSIQSIQVPQTTTPSVPATSVVQAKPNVQWRIVESPATTEVNPTQLQIKPQTKAQPTNSITLPVAPFVSEQRIPTNIVTPTPKPPSTQQQVRPMNRVLPMQTIKELKKPVITEKSLEKNFDEKAKFFTKIDMPKVQILHDLHLKTEDAMKFKEKSIKALIEPIKPMEPIIETKSFKTIESKPMFETDVHFQAFFPEKKDIFQPKIDKIIESVKQPLPSPPKKLEIESISENMKANILDMPKLDDLNTEPTTNKSVSDRSCLDRSVFRDSFTKQIGGEEIRIFAATDSDLLKPKLVKPVQSIAEKEFALLKKEEIDKKLKVISKTQEDSKTKLNSFESKDGNGKIAVSEQKPAKEKSISNQALIMYTVETQDGFKHSSTSLGELWGKVFEAVQTARINHNMTPLPNGSLDIINNLQLLGLKTNGLKYLIEQLPGASKCTKYKPTFHSLLDQDASLENFVDHTGGAVRCVPHQFKKDEHIDMFGWLASRHRNLENFLLDSELMPRRALTTNLPMAMRFRTLKTTSKMSVGVYRSEIHGRGLFALRNFESGEMVIEYSGEVIRSILTDKREKYYNSKGIGCYMFRIDDNLVIDATMKGNAARFINHSCDPNCYSKVVEIHGHKHIIIFALRKIICQEELTYDYKFPFEEDKIPCTCGARRCRKFLN